MSAVNAFPWESVFQKGRRPNLPDDEITVEMVVQLLEEELEITFIGYHLDNCWWVHCQGNVDLPLDPQTQQVLRWKY